MPSLDPPLGLIPAAPEELTPSWLAAILTRSGYSAAIEAIEFQPIEGSALTSRITRVRPRMQDETTGVAPALLWKRSLDDPEARALFQRGYEREVHFYRELAPTVRVARPRCLAAAFDPDTGAHVLLLEDLAPAAPGDPVEGVELQRAALVLAELAKLHASTWQAGAERQPPEEFARLIPLVEQSFEAGARYLGEHVDDRAADRTTRYAPAVPDLFASLSAAPRALCHGDPHPGNILFSPVEGAPALIDWQGSGPAAPMRDVGRFLALGLTVEDRRAHEDELLDGYLLALERSGVRYGRTAAIDHYRTALALQWGWAVLRFRFESAWDEATHEVMPHLMRRAAAAFDDASAGWASGDGAVTDLG